MEKEKRGPGRPRKDRKDLVNFSIKIPWQLKDVLDKAAADSYDTRNMIIRRILEQYFSGQLSRADMTPLDYSNAIDFDAAETRLYPQVKIDWMSNEILKLE